jgi:predicted SAM-dependent methyltransferase
VAKPVEELEKLCAVPGTDLPLVFDDEGRARAPDGRCFRAVGGVPILRDEPAPLVERPKDLASGGLPPERIAHMESMPGYTLFLGAGNSNFRHPRVIEVEYDLFRDTDVVADAHALPFHSNAFDLFVAMNVFEHLRRPHEVAHEVMRVLQPGGEVQIHTAFLQPLHEAPAHFYNATEFGVREWFRDFEDVEVHVSWNFNPLYSLAWLSSDLLATVEQHLGADASARIGGLTMTELAAFWRGPAGWHPEAHAVFTGLPEPAQRGTAAGFDLHARKPG